MNLVEDIDEYNINNVYFADSVENTIMNNSLFIRLIYSSKWFIMNGLYIDFDLNNVVFDKMYNRYKCTFNFERNKDVCSKLIKYENEILEKINIRNKTRDLSIAKSLYSENIKVYYDDNINININNTNRVKFIIKLSGIWETSKSYGITFKIVSHLSCNI